MKVIITTNEDELNKLGLDDEQMALLLQSALEDKLPCLNELTVETIVQAPLSIPDKLVPHVSSVSTTTVFGEIRENDDPASAFVDFEQKLRHIIYMCLLHYLAGVNSDEYWGSEEDIETGNSIYKLICELVGFDINKDDDWGSATIKATSTEIDLINIYMLASRYQKELGIEEMTKDDNLYLVVDMKSADEQYHSMNMDFSKSMRFKKHVETDTGIWRHIEFDNEEKTIQVRVD